MGGFGAEHGRYSLARMPISNSIQVYPTRRILALSNFGRSSFTVGDNPICGSHSAFACGQPPGVGSDQHFGSAQNSSPESSPVGALDGAQALQAPSSCRQPASVIRLLMSAGISFSA